MYGPSVTAGAPSCDPHRLRHHLVGHAVRADELADCVELLVERVGARITPANSSAGNDSQAAGCRRSTACTSRRRSSGIVAHARLFRNRTSCYGIHHGHDRRQATVEGRCRPDVPALAGQPRADDGDDRAPRGLGVSPRAHCVLANALTGGSCTQTELAELVGLDKTTMVVTLDELERGGAGRAPAVAAPTGARASSRSPRPARGRSPRPTRSSAGIYGDVLAALPEERARGASRRARRSWSAAGSRRRWRAAAGAPARAARGTDRSIRRDRPVTRRSATVDICAPNQEPHR